MCEQRNSWVEKMQEIDAEIKAMIKLSLGNEQNISTKIRESLTPLFDSNQINWFDLKTIKNEESGGLRLTAGIQFINDDEVFYLSYLL